MADYPAGSSNISGGSTFDADQFLVQRIEEGDSAAWEELIARYEGRLLAFVEHRLRNRASAEDIVQETFIGFLNSLPNYDRRRPLESYLFTICSYKLTDHLRREGRRPALAMSQSGRDPAMPPGKSLAWVPVRLAVSRAVANGVAWKNKRS